MPYQTRDYTVVIRQHGFRVTAQRRLILDAICEGGGHTTVEEITARVKAKTPSPNRATIYRTLDFLCAMKLVVAADVGGGHTVYEIAGEKPHHPLICRNCGGQAPLSHELVKTLFARVEREQGFVVDPDHLALFGFCRQCQRAQQRGDRLGPTG